MNTAKTSLSTVKDAVQDQKDANRRNLATLHPLAQLEVLILMQQCQVQFHDEYSRQVHYGLMIELRK